MGVRLYLALQEIQHENQKDSLFSKTIISISDKERQEVLENVF